VDDSELLKNLTPAQRCIPYIVAFCDFIMCIGAGMTVKYFPLFFKNDYGFTPMHVCILTAIYPPCIGLWMQLAQKLSTKMGRAHASLMWQLAGCTCLFLMSQVYHLPSLIVLFLVRGAFQNACNPLDRSILMDYTPSKHRGKWNAVESLTMMTWSGSAFIGGMLADSHDYRYTFMITAFIYLFALAVYSPLIVLVPRNEADALAHAKPRTDSIQASPKITRSPDALAFTSSPSSLRGRPPRSREYSMDAVDVEHLDEHLLSHSHSRGDSHHDPHCYPTAVYPTAVDHTHMTTDNVNYVRMEDEHKTA